MTESSMNKPLGEPDETPVLSLKRRVINGSMWTLAGHGAGQIIRLGSNLILTRLLFPEAFGLMTLVYTIISGLTMFSDIGIIPNIVRSSRGGDPNFLNTAWTVQVVRGGGLWLVSCVLAFPTAQFYNDRRLLLLVPAAGFINFVSSFISTNWATANRTLSLRRLTVMEVGTQVLGVGCMILVAFVAKALNAPEDVSIWSLLVGGLIANVSRLILSNTYLEGIRNRFCWEKEALEELTQFGRWIFISTIMTFFALQGNNLLIPRLVGVSFLGVFSSAQSLSRATMDVLTIIGHRVLYPSYAELVRERPERLYPVLRRSRMALNLMNWVISLGFIFLGKPLIHLMYDNRYADAGWMLQIMALGSLVSILGASYTDVLLAQGKTFLMFLLMGIQVGVQFGSMFIGHYYYGEYGAIVSIAISSWLLYPIQAIYLARLKLWQPEVDLPTIALASGIGALVFLHYI